MAQQYDSFMRQHMRGKYSHMDMAIADVNNTLYHYKDLKVKFQKFHFNDGSAKDLINLSGTIPVTYKNNRYNIPVALWLQEQHPAVAPICYVQPTSTMQVRQGKHVDMNGRIYLHYLSEWHSRTHSISGCIQFMCVIFGQEPPVFSRQAAPQPQVRTPYPSQPNVYPPRPPYPYASPQGPPSTNYQPIRTPYPQQTHTPYPSVPATTNYPPYPNYSPHGGAPRPPAPVNMPYPPVQNAGLLPAKTDPALDDDMILASLRSAVDDKIKRRLKDTHGHAAQELSELKRTEGDLKKGNARVQQIEITLKEEIEKCESAAALLEEKNESTKKEIDNVAQKQDDLKVDDYVCATTPVYRQIVAAYSKEQAIDDLIYHLSVAYNKEAISLDTFLKEVRSNYREQFKLRSLIEKARKTAKLENGY